MRPSPSRPKLYEVLTEGKSLTAEKKRAFITNRKQLGHHVPPCCCPAVNTIQMVHIGRGMLLGSRAVGCSESRFPGTGGRDGACGYAFSRGVFIPYCKLGRGGIFFRNVSSHATGTKPTAAVIAAAAATAVRMKSIRCRTALEKERAWEKERGRGRRHAERVSGMPHSVRAACFEALLVVASTLASR